MRIFQIIATISVAALAGCSQLSETQRAMLSDGIAAYEQKQYPRSVERLTEFMSQVRGQPEVSQAAYVRGMSQIKLGRRADAFRDLSRATEAPGDPESVWRAYVQLSTLHFEDNQFDYALRMAVAAVGRMPSRPPRDAMLFRQGVCYERLGRWDDARRPFRQVADEYPETTFGKAGKRRLSLNARHFAVQCGSFSDARNARSLLDRLARSGFRPYLRGDESGPTRKQIVMVGQFSAYGEALQQLTAVRSVVPDAVMWP